MSKYLLGWLFFELIELAIIACVYFLLRPYVKYLIPKAWRNNFVMMGFVDYR